MRRPFGLLCCSALMGGVLVACASAPPQSWPTVVVTPDNEGGAWFVDNGPAVVGHVASTGDVNVFAAGEGQLAGIAVDAQDQVWFSNASYSDIVSFSPVR